MREEVIPARWQLSSLFITKHLITQPATAHSSGFCNHCNSCVLVELCCLTRGPWTIVNWLGACKCVCIPSVSHLQTSCAVRRCDWEKSTLHLSALIIIVGGWLQFDSNYHVSNEFPANRRVSLQQRTHTPATGKTCLHHWASLGELLSVTNLRRLVNLPITERRAAFCLFWQWTKPDLVIGQERVKQATNFCWSQPVTQGTDSFLTTKATMAGRQKAVITCKY